MKWITNDKDENGNFKCTHPVVKVVSDISTNGCPLVNILFNNNFPGHTFMYETIDECLEQADIFIDGNEFNNTHSYPVYNRIWHNDGTYHYEQ